MAKVTYRGPTDAAASPLSVVRKYRVPTDDGDVLLVQDTPTDVPPDVADQLREVEGHRFEFAGAKQEPKAPEATKADAGAKQEPRG